MNMKERSKQEVVQMIFWNELQNQNHHTMSAPLWDHPDLLRIIV